MAVCRIPGVAEVNSVTETPRPTRARWVVAAAQAVPIHRKAERAPQKGHRQAGTAQTSRALEQGWVTLGNLLHLSKSQQFICEMGQNYLPSQLHKKVARSKYEVIGDV